jgi:hypothetical protein
MLGLLELFGLLLLLFIFWTFVTHVESPSFSIYKLSRGLVPYRTIISGPGEQTMSAKTSPRLRRLRRLRPGGHPKTSCFSNKYSDLDDYQGGSLLLKGGNKMGRNSIFEDYIDNSNRIY